MNIPTFEPQEVLPAGDAPAEDVVEVDDAPPEPPRPMDRAPEVDAVGATIGTTGGGGSVDVESSRFTAAPRLLIVLGRVLLWTAILAVLTAGVIAIADAVGHPIVELPTAAPEQVVAPDPSPERAEQWPREAAGTYAVQVTTDWLAGGDGTAAGMLPVTGTVDVAQMFHGDVDVAPDGRTATGSVLVLLVDGRWLRMHVPMILDEDRPVATGPPVLVATEAAAARPAEVPRERVDEDAGRLLAGDLEAFFDAYADGGPALARWLADGTSLAGLDGTVTPAGISDVQVLAGSGPTTIAYATVRWRLSTGAGDATATLTQTYRVELTSDGGRPYVVALSPAVPVGQEGR